MANAIDWNTKASHLKAVFPLSASNDVATYNWDIGTIERPTDVERQFEVASHQWVDLTDKSGSGFTVIVEDCVGIGRFAGACVGAHVGRNVLHGCICGGVPRNRSRVRLFIALTVFRNSSCRDSRQSSWPPLPPRTHPARSD